MGKKDKPLGRKSYGSIGHLPNSRLGPGDHKVADGQARICTEKARDKHDKIIVQEKLDGSCTAVAMVNGEVLALGRAGYLASSSPFVMHHMFADWVKENELRFKRTLKEGERLVGEWLAMAHGTKYRIGLEYEPWGVFDLMVGCRRATVDELAHRVGGVFCRPHELHAGPPLSVADAMSIHAERHWPCEEPEGVVYRVERKGEVDYLAKWVRLDKTDGKYLPEVSGVGPVWNWSPDPTRAPQNVEV